MNKYNYSIIIPHYGTPFKLRRLLSTIPIRDDLQVIVVDDCSPEIYDADIFSITIDFNNIEFYYTNHNKGGGYARNIGIEHAKGKYLIFADADDFFLPSFDDILSIYADKNFDLVFFNAISLGENTFQISNRTNHLNQYIGHKSIDCLKYLFGEPWCKIIKTEIVREHQIRFEEVPVHNDTLFSYMIGFFSKKIGICNRVCYVVIEREGSVSKTISWKRCRLRTKIFSEKYKFFQAHSINICDENILTSFCECIKLKNFDEFKINLKIAELYGISKWFIFYKLLKRVIRKII